MKKKNRLCALRNYSLYFFTLLPMHLVYDIEKLQKKKKQRNQTIRLFYFEIGFGSNEHYKYCYFFHKKFVWIFFLSIRNIVGRN